MLGEKYVRRTYNAFRSKYWPDAGMPDFEELDFEFAENPGEFGSVEWDEHGNASMSLDPSLRVSRPLLRAVLLHEMAHIRLGPGFGHGRQFYAEALRVCGLGGIREVF